MLYRPIIFEHISALLFTPTQYSILLIERAVFGLLQICLILADKVSCLGSKIPYQLLITILALTP